MKSIDALLKELQPNHLYAQATVTDDDARYGPGLRYVRDKLAKQLAQSVMADPRFVRHDATSHPGATVLNAAVVVMTPEQLRELVLGAYTAGRNTGYPVWPTPTWTTQTEVQV